MENNQENTDSNKDECKSENRETKEITSLPEEQSNNEVTSCSSNEPVALTGNEEMVSQLTDGFLAEVQPQLLELREKTKEIT